MNNGIASYILSIADVSKQADKIAMFMAVPSGLKQLIDGSISGELKFGISNVKHKPPAVHNVTATAEQLERSITLVLNAKGNDKRRMIDRFVELYDAPSIELIVKVVTGKLKIGLGAKLAGIDKFSVQLASDYKNKKHDNWSVYFTEEKIDGMRCVIFIDSLGKAEAFTRGGKPINTINHVLEELIDAVKYSVPGVPVVFDGEIAAETFKETIHLVKRKDSTDDSTNTIYHVFDMLLGVTKEDYLAGKFGDATLQLRKRWLTSYLVQDFPVQLNFVKVVHFDVFNSIADVIAKASYNIDLGKEGIIAKHPHALYELKRAQTWFKIKDVLSKDLIIEDYKAGTGKYEGKLGAIIVSHNGVQVSVGGGFTDQERFELWEHPDSLIGRIAEIEYHQETPDGSLRHPRFKRFRDHFEHGVKE